ncbi:MAG TPA: efflux RND transporter permease subunit, partial [Bacteroidia bacterium]|nr:efflux RND transporter permease subunit [Bacteroidia bacterium]
VSAPPPFGGNQRSVLIKADPDRLKSYNITPDELAMAIAKNNAISPAGNVRVGNFTMISPSNSVVDNIQELENIPLKTGSGTSIYVRDVATVQNGADVTTGYALINGKRSVYIPVTKRADASTWDVVQNIKNALPDLQAAIPDDIKVSYEFDQSGYVINSLTSLIIEGLLGAILTGLMVLLFLRDWRSALVVVITIPLALLAAVVCLYLMGQTINVMTLGGLALSIGILVDQATISIENIHQHLESGKPKARAVIDACKEISLPQFLILLSILAVFVPSLFMSGVPRAMFLPLSLAVGFSLIASFILSQTFVPVFANWMLSDKKHSNENDWFQKIRTRFEKFSDKFSRYNKFVILTYFLPAFLMIFIAYKFIGTEIFPKVDSGQFQVRVQMPAGTRIERTEDATKNTLAIIDSLAGKGNVEVTSAFVGMQPPTYAINPIYLWTSGPHEAVIKVNLNKKSGISIEDFKEKLRQTIKKKIPAMQLSFEPADLVDQVMSQGSSNPIEVVIQGKNLSQSREYAEQIKKSLQEIPYLRDVQFGLPLDYPTLQINYDRVRTGQMGLTVDEASKSLTIGTYSSRLTQPVYWLDKTTGTAYQVQVEYPQFKMNNADQVEQIPVSTKNGNEIFLRDIADWRKISTAGEYDRINQQRYITVTANLNRKDLGSAIKDVNEKIKNIGDLPQGIKIYLRGQSVLLDQTLFELATGLALAIIVIFLLLAANFQSFKLSLKVISVVPAVVAGSWLLLLICGKTLNIQSFMGSIMAIGVAVSNAILLVSNAEQLRKQNSNHSNYGLIAAKSRLRPILMTTFAMIAGMIPMAIGLGEGGEQTSPLGIAVIGGLILSTTTSLFIVPGIYHSIIGTKKYKSGSLDPDDAESKYYGS